jgi:hypothetical protein
MNKKSNVVLPIALFALVFSLLLPVSLPAQLGKLCCIAGTYEGFQVPYAKPNCRFPQKQTFTMVVMQAKLCAAEIKGTVTDSSGVVSDWTGVLSLGRRGCCRLEGHFLTPSGNTVVFKGTICQKHGKWKATGTWEEINSSDPCKGAGTWEMTHI